MGVSMHLGFLQDNCNCYLSTIQYSTNALKASDKDSKQVIILTSSSKQMPKRVKLCIAEVTPVFRT